MAEIKETDLDDPRSYRLHGPTETGVARWIDRRMFRVEVNPTTDMIADTARTLARYAAAATARIADVDRELRARPDAEAPNVNAMFDYEYAQVTGLEIDEFNSTVTIDVHVVMAISGVDVENEECKREDPFRGIPVAVARVVESVRCAVRDVPGFDIEQIGDWELVHERLTISQLLGTLEKAGSFAVGGLERSDETIDGAHIYRLTRLELPLTDDN